jgi:signal transduction histidine kinase
MIMGQNIDKNFGDDLFKSIGHETRTLLNTITGPIEIIRMYSDDSRLIEPLKILELSAYRFEKFSLRALLISDILSSKGKIEVNEFDIGDCLKHIILELDDFLNFYKIQINHQDLEEVRFVKGNSNIIFQCLEVLLEHSLQISPQDSVIYIRGLNIPNGLFRITIPDNGFLTKKFNKIDSSESLPTEIDLAFFVLATSNQQNIAFKFESTEDKSIAYVLTK